MTYEKKIRRLTRDWTREQDLDFYPAQWLSFCDAHGLGWAQPDSFIDRGDVVIVIECKLTQADGAESQCCELYKPLLERIFQKPVICIQVFKNLRYEIRGKMLNDFSDLLTLTEGYWLWHNLGT